MSFVSNKLAPQLKILKKERQTEIKNEMVDKIQCLCPILYGVRIISQMVDRIRGVSDVGFSIFADADFAF